MSRILLDTNAAIDIVFPREPDRRASIIGALGMLDAKKDELLLPSLCLKDLSWFLECSRACKERWPNRDERLLRAAQAREFLLAHATIVAIDELVCKRAHANTTERDYDDALVAECAVTSGADVILSSDAKAFVASQVPKMTPHELLVHLSLGA